MIKDFEISDLSNFEPNKFSVYEEFEKVFQDDNILKYTCHSEGKVEAIIGFFPYCGNAWSFFVLFSKDFKSIYLKELKKFYILCIEKIQPDRVATDSLDLDFNNKLHRMFGLELEGTRKRHMYGQDMNMWGKIWE